jgi:hypothetical protein
MNQNLDIIWATHGITIDQQVDEEFVSLHLPTNHTRESVQYEYCKTKIGRKQYKR